MKREANLAGSEVLRSYASQKLSLLSKILEEVSVIDTEVSLLFIEYSVWRIVFPLIIFQFDEAYFVSLGQAKLSLILVVHDIADENEVSVE